TDEGTTNPSKDIQYVDWFDSDGTVDRFIARTKTAPYAYSFAAPHQSSYTLKASATDFSNNTSDLATFTWNVAPNNAPADVKVAVTPASLYLSNRADAQV